MIKTVRKFGRDDSGVVAVIAGLVLVVIIGCAGLALDYSRASALKTRLQAAADAAVLAAINTENEDKARIEAEARNRFRGSLSQDDALSLIEVTPEYQATPEKSVSLRFRAQSQNSILPALNSAFFPANGKARAVTAAPQRLRVHFLLDDSASMGIGATEADRTAMLEATFLAASAVEPTKTERGCEFACHIPDDANGINYLDIARSIDARLRLDLVKAGVERMMSLFQQNPPGQTEVSFSLSVFARQFETLVPVTGDTGLINRAIDDLELGRGLPRPEVTTSFDTSFAQAAAYYGDMVSSSAGDIVILVTDGLQADGYATQSAITPEQCRALSGRLRRVGVIYLPYQKLDHDAWRAHVEKHMPAIETNIRLCPSTGLFAQGEDGNDIIRAFEDLFDIISNQRVIRLAS